MHMWAVYVDLVTPKHFTDLMPTISVRITDT